MRPHALALVLVLAPFGCNGDVRNPGPETQGPIPGGYTSDPTNPGGGGTAPPNTDYCALVTDVLCGRILDCFRDPAIHAECVADLVTSCTGQAPCSPDEIFHPELLDACLAEIPGLSCNDLQRGNPGVCDGVCEKRGTTPPRS